MAGACRRPAIVNPARPDGLESLIMLASLRGGVLSTSVAFVISVRRH
jgi:hypothetical protein